MFTLTDRGIYLPEAGLYIDPWKMVDRAIITHAHSDHARLGMNKYLATHETCQLLKYRLGNVNCQGLAYGESITIRRHKISLHPAGHIVGSSQVRVEYKGKVLVVTGDYKLGNDGFCTPFESIPCHQLITESTFGLPVFQWEEQAKVMEDINSWWQKNASEKRPSVLLLYALGKAQRVLSKLPQDALLFGHGAICGLNDYLKSLGYLLPFVKHLDTAKKSEMSQSLILAPVGVLGSKWMQRIPNPRIAYVSGWMMLRGNKRRLGIDKGFVLSDHADWHQLNTAIRSSGADEVFVTHGFKSAMATWLSSNGIKAYTLDTAFTGELASKSTDEQNEVHL